MAFLKYCVPACALILIACDPTPGDTPLNVTEIRPSVHALVITGATTAQAQVRKVDPSRDIEIGGNPGDIISGARVTLITDPARVDLKEAPADLIDCIPPQQRVLAPNQRQPALGCYAARLPAPITAGQTYSLDVQLPGGGSVTGTTRAIAAPQLLSPQPNQQIRRQLREGSGGLGYDAVLPFRWSPNPDFRANEIAITALTGFRNGAAAPALRCNAGITDAYEVPRATRSDSLTLRLVNLQCSETTNGRTALAVWDSLRLNVRLAVFDSTYARYISMLESSKVRLDQASAGITGALGVFGSGAVADVPVTILP